MNFDDELAFLADNRDDDVRDETDEQVLQHQLVTSPLLNFATIKHQAEAFPSRGLLGTTNGERLYINTNTPSCGVICGVQGSGKSHTVSCILEASLVNDSRIGTLPHPLAACVFHFDEQDCNRPAEAAFLSLPASENASREDRDRLPKIVVLCSPSNVSRRRRAYATLPHVAVEPLYLSERDLTAERMLTIMGCDNMETMPLYMHSVLLIIRNMGVDAFNYQDFKRQIHATSLNSMQRAMVKLRLDLLDAFLHPGALDLQSYFGAGQLVLVDLTDPFLDGKTAGVFFDIVLGSFMQWQTATGKIVVLDEAHKYLINNDTAHLTLSISSIIRQQRHLATRIIISTQEPTVIPSTILDLASFIFCHRFTSPSWCTHLAQHVSAGDGAETARWFQDVMLLSTGHCVVFSPSALMMKSDDSSVRLLGRSYLKLRVRPRLTLDGGTSLLAVRQTVRSVDYEAPVVDTPWKLPDLPLAHAQFTPVLQSTASTHEMPRSTVNWGGPIVDTPLMRPDPLASFVPLPRTTLSNFATPFTVIPGAVNAGSTYEPRAVPMYLKHLIECLQRNGGVNAPMVINRAYREVLSQERQIHVGQKKKEWWDPLLGQAEARGLVELRNVGRTNKELKVIGEKRTIRLLHPGPFMWA